MGYWRAARILMSVISILVGAEMASAQSRTRDCFIDRHGRRICDGRGPVTPPPHHRPPPHFPPPSHRPPPHYPPPYNPPPYYPPQEPGYGYALSEFARHEQDAIHFNEIYLRAPSGSWEEQRAREDRDESIRRALSSLREYGDLERLRADEVLDFAREMDRKYRAASSGSALERMYWDAGALAWPSVRTAELRENEYSRDFREVESRLLTFVEIYRRASSGSREERTAWDLAQDLIRLVVQKFEEQRHYLDRYELDRIAYEYDDRYRRASSGSLEERYFRQIRDLAR